MIAERATATAARRGQRSASAPRTYSHIRFVVTLQHSSTTSCQVSDHIQTEFKRLFSESDNRIVPCKDRGAGAAVLEVGIALDQAWARAVEPFRRALLYISLVTLHAKCTNPHTLVMGRRLINLDAP